MGLGPKPAVPQFFLPCLSQPCPLVMETPSSPRPRAYRDGVGASPTQHLPPDHLARWCHLSGALPTPAPLCCLSQQPLNLQVSQVLIYPAFRGEKPPFILLRLEKTCTLQRQPGLVTFKVKPHLADGGSSGITWGPAGSVGWIWKEHRAPPPPEPQHHQRGWWLGLASAFLPATLHLCTGPQPGLAQVRTHIPICPPPGMQVQDPAALTEYPVPVNPQLCL